VDEHTTALVIDLHRGLRRQGPGSPQSTARALSLISDLPPEARIIDLGCGSGAQTLDLLQRIEGATVLAVDQSPELLAELQENARAAGLDARLSTLQADMLTVCERLPHHDFTLVWSEAAAYSVGFDAALKSWRTLLTPGGFIGVSELSWSVDPSNAAAELRAFWSEEYPAMRTTEENRAAFEAAGYDLIDAFPLTTFDFWDNYYAPLAERISAFEARHPGDESAKVVADMTRREIEVFRRYGSAYDYVFFVGRRR